MAKEKPITPHEQALRLLEEGKALVAKAKYTHARDKFGASVEIYPTAEGLTLWGWMLSLDGEVDRAISLCRQAIELDPEYGNAYNDIGSYLVELGKEDEAIAYFEKAKLAPKYDTPNFPYLNLARLYLKEDKFEKACAEYRALLKIDGLNTEANFVLGYFGKDENTPYPFFGLFPPN